MKYIEAVNDKIVSPVSQELIESLKGKYGTSQSYDNLMEEINSIHLNHEKKFLLHDPQNTMGVPEPSPKIDEFVHETATTFKRFGGFSKTAI